MLEVREKAIFAVQTIGDMLKVKHFVMALAAALFASCGASAPAGGGSAVRRPVASVDAADAARTRIQVHTATTQRGRTVPLSAGFFVELHGDSLLSELPYFGRAYSAPIGTDNVLSFDAPVRGLARSATERGAARLEFTVRTIEDTFRFRIDISGADADISVRPQRRESISFRGDVVGP